jgi:hypothetical protein
MAWTKLSFTPISGGQGGTVTDSPPPDAASPRPAPARDLARLTKALLQAHPRDTLQLLCGVQLDGHEVVEQPDRSSGLR